MSRKHIPTSEDYGDRDLYGSLFDKVASYDRSKAVNDPECVIFGINTFADKREQWVLKDLIGYDKRLKALLKDRSDKSRESISFAMPIQSYCWPKMHASQFPLLCIAPQTTGKTYAHLLYTVTQSIKGIPSHETDKMLKGERGFICEADINEETTNLRNYPACLVVTSTHDQAELLTRTVDRFKENAYEIQSNEFGRLKFMPPIARSVSVDQPDDKIALRCHESQILIGTPAALIKCLELQAISFCKARHVVFDDLDLSLQVWNYKIQELVGIYASQIDLMRTPQVGENKFTSKRDSKSKPCQMIMFSRKWTELLKKFVTSLFRQRTIIFGSLAEAAIYLNIRFELEFHNDQEEKLSRLVKLINYITNSSLEVVKQPAKRYAIVCSEEDEALELKQQLSAKIDRPIRLINAEELSHQSIYTGQQPLGDPIIVITDSAIDYEVEFSPSRQSLDNIEHLIHFSVPTDMLAFDRRFKLMYKLIQDETAGLMSTIFIGPSLNAAQTKQIYDLISRSGSTLRGTKSELRHYMDSKASALCWRWATTGVCRFEKLSREDRFGSYCTDRHSLLPLQRTHENQWPISGQLMITLTHVISPSEFFFWFEAHRDIRKHQWTKFATAGQEFMRKIQLELDKLREVKPRSVPLERIVKGRVYAVYFQQEARVDRVLLLDEPKHKITRSSSQDQQAVSTSMAHINPLKEYRALVPVIKIDYGSRVDVYVENIVELPASLASLGPQCHRGFHIGFRPISNEPNWHHRTKRQFFEKVTAQNIRSTTVWLRFNRDNCFWFEHMTVSRQLANIDSSDILNLQPHRELVQEGLAEMVKSEPSFLPSSIRLLTLGKWNSLRLTECAQYAFLRKDKPVLDLFLLNVFGPFNAIVRQVEFNGRLIDLEKDMLADYKSGRLMKQQHFEENIFCLARIVEGQEPETKEIIYTINRVKIAAIDKIKRASKLESNLDLPEDTIPSGDHEYSYKVECLDHGDCFYTNREDLYEAPASYFKTLPFQAIACQLANINSNLLDGDTNARRRVFNQLIDLSRTQANLNKVLKCRLDNQEKLYLYVMDDDEKSDNNYHPMSKRLFEKYKVRLHANPMGEFEKAISPTLHDLPDEYDKARMLFIEAVNSILQNMIREELLKSGADAKSIENDLERS